MTKSAMTLLIVVAALGVVPASARDSGVGSYSNQYGQGWTKVCCDYPYYHPFRRYRTPRPRH